MRNLFTSLNNAVAGAAPIACNHNHALVHNPFAWNEQNLNDKADDKTRPEKTLER